MNLILEGLVLAQALGAVVGVIASIRGEVAYVQAMRDGSINGAEAAHLKHIAQGLRFGMTILLFASLGLVIVSYLLKAPLQPGLQAAYWAEMLLALLVIGSSWGLSKGKTSFSFGAAVVFSGWWFLALLALGKIPALSFGAVVALYVLAAAILFALLWYTRLFLASR